MMARPPGQRPRAVIKLAVARYMDDELVQTIASDLGVKQPTISYWMKTHGRKIGGRLFRRRHQGRRIEEAPGARDAEIMSLADCGMPISKIGERFGLSRQRVDFIVQTWTERGYKPVQKFKVGDIVYVEYPDEEVGTRHEKFKLKDIYPDHTAAVAQIVAEKVNGDWVDIEDGPECNELKFFYKGKLVELLTRDGSPSQSNHAETQTA